MPKKQTPEDKLKEFQEKLTKLLKEYNYTLQVVHNINIVPLPEETSDKK